MTKQATIECMGCSDGYEHDGVSLYTVMHHDGTVDKGVRYCTDCADLARMDWNGETAGIEVAS